MKTITNAADSDRREAEAWLARALRWERVLGDLREHRGTDVRADRSDIAAVQDEPVRRPEAA